MYERNYKDGKWHGTVTRWWPNGQKMYVRAYSKGIRHGKEATWRSDGTPVSISSDTASEVGRPVKTKPVSDKVESLETTDLPSIELPAFEEDEAPKSSSPPIDLNSQITENGAQSPSSDNSNVPAVEPEIETDPSGFDGFPPPLPPLDDPIADEDIAEPSSEDDSSLLLPEMNDAEASNSGFSEDNVLGDLPPADSLEGAPPLPPLDDSNELPELPSLDNSDADSDPLPPLSDMESVDDLPPLPAGDSDFDSLPPLPPLP